MRIKSAKDIKEQGIEEFAKILQKRPDLFISKQQQLTLQRLGEYEKQVEQKNLLDLAKGLRDRPIIAKQRRKEVKELSNALGLSVPPARKLAMERVAAKIEQDRVIKGGVRVRKLKKTEEGKEFQEFLEKTERVTPELFLGKSQQKALLKYQQKPKTERVIVITQKDVADTSKLQQKALKKFKKTQEPQRPSTFLKEGEILIIKPKTAKRIKKKAKVVEEITPTSYPIAEGYKPTTTTMSEIGLPTGRGAEAVFKPSMPTAQETGGYVMTMDVEAATASPYYPRHPMKIDPFQPKQPKEGLEIIKPITVEGDKTKYTIDTKEDFTALLQGKPEYGQKVKERPMIAQVIKEKPIQKISPEYVFMPKYQYQYVQDYTYDYAIKQEYKQQMKQVFKIKEVLKPLTKIKEDIIHLPPKPVIITPPSPKLSQSSIKRALKKFQTQKGYELLIRREGEWRKVEGTYPLGVGKKKGAEIVRSTLAASFKLLPSKRITTKKDRPFEPKGDVFRTYKKVKGVKVELPLTYIQRRKYRLSTRAEVGEIQRARFFSLKKSKGGKTWM